ncbi:DUF1491 family protein [Croceicoccus naphthovorans]|uniref:Uncharacterized protein n=1 Tax=Croceicoccus naphthovorans TaxID=1348774 RepID=A0A0G3XKU6_9SPHN|nr:DUF1491 family protein [Croceicoccus naphthovorans]AKM11214.1 hypothetical protein AB433_16525 [Croceicoccus naphthovorans]MBB3989887.1 hypothetical protein [Croceicoccus naphthovorans]
MDSRLPAHLEVSALIRACEAAGGFATIVKKGEKDAGTILIVACEKGCDSKLYERMPTLDGDRKWTVAKAQESDKPLEFSDYLERRGRQDSDCWIVELDVANAQQLIAG